MNRLNVDKILAVLAAFCCFLVQPACAQPQTENVNFLTPSSYNRIVTNADKVTAILFNQDARGHTIKQPDNALFGFDVKDEKVVNDDYTIKKLRNFILNANNYDTSGYLPKCGFDPDYGLIFHEGEKTTQVMLMLRKDCNPIKFNEGAEYITTKDLRKQGRDQLLPIFRSIFPDQSGRVDPTEPSVPTAPTVPDPSQEQHSTGQPPQHDAAATTPPNNRGGNHRQENNPKNHPPIEEYHVIKSNHDTIYSLAKKYNTTVDKIKELNPGLDPTKLKKDDKVRVR